MWLTCKVTTMVKRNNFSCHSLNIEFSWLTQTQDINVRTVGKFGVIPQVKLIFKKVIKQKFKTDVLL